MLFTILLLALEAVVAEWLFLGLGPKRTGVATLLAGRLFDCNRSGAIISGL